jgi:PhnB protein
MEGIVPEICVHDGPAALEFYKEAFGAVETARMMSPGGKLVHGELTIGTCRCPRTLGGTGTSQSGS